MRRDRRPDELRRIRFQMDASPYAAGSCVVETGRTKVLCVASVEKKAPKWRASSGLGWVTAEYAMLPGATHTRARRERRGAKGRTLEIERLIGRSLRAMVDMKALGDKTVTVDCDVLVADGGTRTASISGAAVALQQAFERLVSRGELDANPSIGRTAAVSVGLLDGEQLLDLEYAEDARADVDLNVAALEGGRIIEVQGTAEGRAFRAQELDEMVRLALAGIDEIRHAQSRALEKWRRTL